MVCSLLQRSGQVLFLLAVAQLVQASPLAIPPPDPSVVILKGGDATPITGSNFTFQSGANAGGIFVFSNQTGTSLAEIDVTATVPDPTPLTGQPYTIVNYVLPGTSESIQTGQTCAGVVGNFDCVNIRLFDPAGVVAISPGATFTFDLNNNPLGDPGVNPPNYTGTDQPNGTGNWGPGTVFGAAAISEAPEAPSLALVGGALLLGALSLRLRRD